MILVTIASWFITFIILATNREKATLWASSIAFLCGLGGFAITIQDYIIPFLKNEKSTVFRTIC